MPEALRLRATSVGAVLLGLLTSGGATAQVTGLEDSGAFEHHLGDAYAGSETFAVRRRGEELVAVGRITREGAAGTLRSFEVGMRLDAQVLPVRYERRSREGPSLHIIVSRAGSRLTTTITSGAGERFTEVLANDRLLVLDPEVAHHYVPLARRLASAADPRRLALEALIPEDGRKVPLRVLTLSRDSLSIAGSTVSATRYELSLGAEASLVWIGTSDGRVLQVALPGRGWSATRTPPEQ